MFQKTKKIAIIGAGIAGLATAARLASKGHAVDLYEKNPGPGGKMSEIRENGYRFDTGPSLFTMPAWLEELFLDTGEKLEDFLVYRKLDIICRYIYGDGSIINAYADPERFATELQYKAGENPNNLAQYLANSERVFSLTEKVFLRSSIHLWRNYLSRDFFKTYLSLPAIRPFEKLSRFNRHSFSDPRVVQIFDRFATYNGSNPYETPATMMVIPHLEHNVGAFFPEGGIFNIADSIVKLAGLKGANLYFNAPVSKILVKDGSVQGLVVNGEKKEYDAIVSDCDVYHVYHDLLGRKKKPTAWFGQERSTSAIIFYWGMSTMSPGLEVHNILFSENYPEEFDHLFIKKTICLDPTVYIFISSKIVKEDAPGGKENWFVMINAPENMGQDWDMQVSFARNAVKEKVRKFTGIHPDAFIEFERVMDPRGLESLTSSHRGSLYGNSSNGLWAAFRRHPNFMPGLKGLFLVGGSVHPGGGIPLCLSSANIGSELTNRYLNS